ncbi:MAG: BACON domain-containing carbohydrate-binding protein [Bacteroidales bacterium]|nr:BACON domain-containing carbohydrate-binding protein [Bacteroidales bacterium]MDY6001970.1 BACON domain-containing carbohydrate-binding protein [Candidatus Cryptobacteroides sp.]
MNIKQILSLSIAAAMVFSACGENETQVDKSSVSLSAETVEAAPEGGIYDITVTSDSDWRVSGFCEWARPLSESGKSGETLRIEVDPSNSRDILTTEFKVFSGSAVKSVKVFSNPSFTMNLLTGNEVELSSSTSTLKIKLDTNVPEIETLFSGSGADWVEYVSRQEVFGNTILTFRVNANETYKDRETELTLSGNGKSASVKILQSQLDAIVTDTQKVVHTGLNASSVTFGVRANVDFTFELPSWLTLVSQEKGASGEDGLTTYTITLSFGENVASRVAELNFVSGGKVLLQVSVKQQNPDAVLFNITDMILRRELVKKGWILASDSSTECELLEPGMTGTSLDISTSGWNALDVTVIDGLDNFHALESLSLNNLNVETLNLDNCAKLNTLIINKLPKLKEAILGNCPITVFKSYLGGMYSEDYFEQKSLKISSENLTEINVSSESNYISYYDNCAEIDVAGCPKLSILKAKRETSDWYGNVICHLEKLYVSQVQKDAIDAGTLTLEKSNQTELVVR